MCGLILRTGAFCTHTADSISLYGVYYMWCGPIQGTQPSYRTRSRMPPRAASPQARKTETFSPEITTDRQGRGPGFPVGCQEGCECGPERQDASSPASSGRRESMALTDAGSRPPRYRRRFRIRTGSIGHVAPTRPNVHAGRFRWGRKHPSRFVGERRSFTFRWIFTPPLSFINISSSSLSCSRARARGRAETYRRPSHRSVSRGGPRYGAHRIGRPTD